METDFSKLYENKLFNTIKGKITIGKGGYMERDGYRCYGNGIYEKVEEPKMDKDMTWISVDNQLPEFDERVLVTDNKHVTIAKLSRIDSKGCAWEKDCTLTFISSREDVYRSVTKWMPLPEID